MIYQLLLILLTALYQTEARFTTSDSKITLLLGETHGTSITVGPSCGLGDCTQIIFYAELEYIAKVWGTGTIKQNNQLNCKIEVKGKALGRTSLRGNITCSENCTSTSEAVIHIVVEKSYFLNVISVFCGWIYFTAWTFSFYPQIYVNWKRKSVIGFNFDFVTLNQLGYLCYSMFNIGLYYIPVIEAEYFEKYPGATNPVQLNDVVFSVHGFLGTAYMIIQVFMYERGGQKMSRIGIVVLGVLLLTLGVTVTGGILNIVTWLECLHYCSYIKLVVTVTKYIPQIVMNYKLKNTLGWSIGAVVCDSLGSVFSMLQMLVLSYNRNDWVSIMGDPTKFGLGLFSVCFDVIFMVQHFILYRHNGSLEEKHMPLPPDIKKQGII